ncbi:hypothetical protein MBGDF03_00869 [Thermoplasmatales archaeon SCGC AB-540-F20]|nr:hypothetical protein MBGDF03_00869 [Thermoplasmatales archaeon SCGC AB-540-F20]
MQLKKKILQDKARKRLLLWFSLTVIFSILFRFFVFPQANPSLWYFTFSITMMFATMALFECVFISLKRKKMKIFGGKPTPKFFEFGFFLCIFIATVYASEIIALSHLPDITTDDKLEIIRQNFWFIGMYGVAIAFGIYHYIFRMD